MIVRELITLLGFKTDTAGLATAKNQFSGLVNFAKKAAGAVAGLTAVAWTRGAVQQTANAAEQFKILSEQTGIAADELQRLSFAAKIGDADLGTVVRSIRFMQRAQVEVTNGNKKVVAMFKTLGLSATDSSGKLKDAKDFLIESADAFKNLKTPAERTALAIKLFGRAGVGMLPMLANGAKGIRDLMKEADDMGIIMGKDLTDASDDYLDNLARLDYMYAAIKQSVGTELIPVLLDLTTGIVKWWKVNKDWIKLGVSKTFDAVGKSMRGLSVIFGVIGGGIKDLLGAFSPTGQKMLLAIAGIKALQMGLISGPIGALLVMAAIVGMIADDWNSYKTGKGSMIGDFAEAIDYAVGNDNMKIFLNGWHQFWKDVEEAKPGTLHNIALSFKESMDMIFPYLNPVLLMVKAISALIDKIQEWNKTRKETAWGEQFAGNWTAQPDFNTPNTVARYPEAVPLPGMPGAPPQAGSKYPAPVPLSANIPVVVNSKITLTTPPGASNQEIADTIVVQMQGTTQSALRAALMNLTSSAPVAVK
jgi:hypothetical protein